MYWRPGQPRRGNGRALSPCLFVLYGGLGLVPVYFMLHPPYTCMHACMSYDMASKGRRDLATQCACGDVFEQLRM